MRDVMMEISSLQQERRFLDTQSATSRIVSTEETPTVVSSPAEKLIRLKAELAEKSVRYSSEHWDIRSLKAEIAALEEQISIRNSMPEGSGQGGSTYPQSETDSHYRTITTRLNLLRDREKNLRGDIEKLQAEIQEMPLVEIELRRLTDQYNVLMEEYGEIRAKRHDAALAQSLEQDQKAERFTLLEPPEVPLEPTRSTLKLLVLALLLSLGGGAGVAYLAEMMDDRIYGQSVLASLVGQEPLAVIPRLHGLPSV